MKRIITLGLSGAFVLFFCFAKAQSETLISGKTSNTEFFSAELYPNPAKQGEKVNLRLKNAKEKEVLVVVFDLLGNEMYSKVIIIDSKDVITAIDPSKRIPSGIYMVVGSSKNELFNQRLVIKN